MEIKEPAVLMNNIEGILSGEDVVCASKPFSKIDFVYENPEGMDPDTIMYDVYSCEKATKGKVGDLIWGMTVLHPITVNGECNMTRGHWHNDRNCAEYYYGIAGEGLLMFMDETGYTFAEKVYPGSLHYIDGKYAHRLINTSNEDFKVGACWNVVGGYDYASTEKTPFGFRVYLENGEVVIKAQ